MPFEPKPPNKQLGFSDLGFSDFRFSGFRFSDFWMIPTRFRISVQKGRIFFANVYLVDMRTATHTVAIIKNILFNSVFKI